MALIGNTVHVHNAQEFAETGKYICVFDPLDGSSRSVPEMHASVVVAVDLHHRGNVDAGIPVGTIFGVFEAWMRGMDYSYTSSSYQEPNMAECELPEDLSAGLTDEQQRHSKTEFCGGGGGGREMLWHWSRELVQHGKLRQPRPVSPCHCPEVSRRHVAARKGQGHTTHRTIQLWFTRFGHTFMSLKVASLGSDS